MDVGLYNCSKGGHQNRPQEKEMKQGKMAVSGGLINSRVKKRSERQRIKGKIYSYECRVPKNIQER